MTQFPDPASMMMSPIYGNNLSQLGLNIKRELPAASRSPNHHDAMENSGSFAYGPATSHQPSTSGHHNGMLPMRSQLPLHMSTPNIPAAATSGSILSGIVSIRSTVQELLKNLFFSSQGLFIKD